MNRNPQMVNRITAAIIGGGLSQRLGGQDKGLVEINGRPQLARLIEALKPQSDAQILVSNREVGAYSAFGLPVVADAWPGQAGPLAGVQAALQYAGAGEVLCVPVDAVKLPPDLLARLQQARAAANTVAACVHDGEGLQPVCCLLPASLADSAHRALSAGQLALHRWLASVGAAPADFSHWPRWAWSFNTQQELDAARMRLAHDEA